MTFYYMLSQKLVEKNRVEIAKSSKLQATKDEPKKITRVRGGKKAWRKLEEDEFREMIVFEMTPAVTPESDTSDNSKLKAMQSRGREKKNKCSNRNRTKALKHACNAGDLNNVETAKPNNGWIHMETTIDSGAVETVCGPEVAAEYITRETEASKRGDHWVSASGDPIINHGEKTVVITMGNRELGTMTYQVADVTKPLASVACICGARHRVVFDDEGSFIENNVTGAIDWLRQSNNTYVLDTWAMPGNMLSTVMPGQTFARHS